MKQILFSDDIASAIELWKDGVFLCVIRNNGKVINSCNALKTYSIIPNASEDVVVVFVHDNILEDPEINMRKDIEYKGECIAMVFPTGDIKVEEDIDVVFLPSLMKVEDEDR